MKLFHLVFNPFEENTYLVADDRGETLVVDPGCASAAECDRLFQTVEQYGLHPRLMVLTHGHFDHFAGCAAVAAQYGIPLGMSQADIPYLPNMLKQGRQFGFDIGDLPEPACWPEDLQEIKWGDASLHIIRTPGHSAGGVCFYAPQEHFLLAGDSLFQGSIGRTDLPGGDYDTLMDSIEQRIMALPPETRLLPGHGPESTLDRERLHNPFLYRLGRSL